MNISYINKDLVEYIQDAKKQNFSRQIIKYDVQAYCDHIISKGGADAVNVFWSSPPNNYILIVELFENGKMELMELNCEHLKNKASAAFDKAMRGI